MKTSAYVFDAYGTLFDLHSVAASLGDDMAPQLSTLWRQKQLEYTWLRALMERYEDFQAVTEAALQTAATQLKIELTDRRRETLMQAWLYPPTFPDVKPALDALKAAPLAILSNGTPKMLDSAIRHNGLESCFAEIISVDRVRTYKPSPTVYALGPQILNIPANEILFVSSNAWDAAGAKAFGYQVCWCNRRGAAPESLGFAPDMTIATLAQLGS